MCRACSMVRRASLVSAPTVLGVGVGRVFGSVWHASGRVVDMSVGVGSEVVKFCREHRAPCLADQSRCSHSHSIWSDPQPQVQPHT